MELLCGRWARTAEEDPGEAGPFTAGSGNPAGRDRRADAESGCPMSSPWPDPLILAPLTKGGNLPFRRLCVDFGAVVTMSEMAFAGPLVRGIRKELALLRKGPTEPCFGVQLAASKPEMAAEAARLAVERGASFVDLNAGCPIPEAVHKGMGACLLDRPRNLERILRELTRTLPVPVTVKLRSGFKDSRINVLETSRLAEEAGVAGIVVHGRTREQRYTRAADWDLVGQVVRARGIPVAGNGDILTWYEARDRLELSGAAGLMLGRGALIKPWLFQEIHEGRELALSASQRVAVYRRLAGYFREHFGEDEHGRERAVDFLGWHFAFFHRYRPLPPEEWLERSREHPLLQTRLEPVPTEDPLEKVLACPAAPVHRRLAEILLESRDDGEAEERLAALAPGLPAPGEGSDRGPGYTEPIALSPPDPSHS